MQTSTPTVKVDRAAKTVTISTMASLMGGDIRKMKLVDGDTLTLDVTMTLDIEGLAKVIGDALVEPEKTGGPDKPGMAKRIAEAVATEGMKEAVKQIVVQIGKSLIS